MIIQPPASQEVSLLHSLVEAQRERLIESLRDILRIPSVQGNPEPGAPFGLEPRRALDAALKLCGELGFRTKNVDGYAGHAEFGQGEEMVAALGHLDVVPEGDGWSHPPYAAEIHGDKIYARGSSDDKGPTYAALFGARALLESGLPLRRRVRVIFGCNEESGFECVRHYWGAAGEERPALAFTPDAGFPLVYAEKGIANLVIEKTPPSSPWELHIVRLAGGRRPNMVPDSAEAILAGPAEALKAAREAIDQAGTPHVRTADTAEGLRLRATGKSAHGSRPDLGDNGVTRLLRALAGLNIPGGDWLTWAADSGDTAGAALGAAGRDDVAGPLTSNLGILEYEMGGPVRLTYNIRYPVTWNVENLKVRTAAALAANGWTVAQVVDQPPLHVPLDQEPAATLLRVYRESTGDTISQPETMGGGTYARATPNAIAFGASFPGIEDGPAHEPDEHIAIETLLAAAKIYAHALWELAR